MVDGCAHVCSGDHGLLCTFESVLNWWEGLERGREGDGRFDGFCVNLVGNSYLCL